jgi:hypothetical protein
VVLSHYRRWSVDCRDERERTGFSYGGGGVLEPWRREDSSGVENSQLLEEAENKYLISLPFFRRGDYIFIVRGLYQ